MLDLLIHMTEKGFIPDPLVRVGIRHLCRARLQEFDALAPEQENLTSNYAEMLRQSPVAVATAAANEQHYELPAEFFVKVLGPHRKYSSSFWPKNCASLAEAEKHALDITMERANITDGMKILELGCGWGSLTLAMAKRFPNSKVTAISNSASQRDFIEKLAKKEKLTNVTVLTRDVSDLKDLGPDSLGSFDRIVSVEMLEHFRNYEVLLERISRWLTPQGKLFVHIFTHKHFPYLFETDGADNWMGKYFFTGGQMPSHNLLATFQKDLKLERQWSWDGTHYQKTAEAWLENLNKNRPEVLAILEQVYGKSESVRWLNRWRVFFLAVAELFGYKSGTEWGVSHYLFKK